MVILKVIFAILICIPFGYLLFYLFSKMMEMLNGFIPKRSNRREKQYDYDFPEYKRRRMR